MNSKMFQREENKPDEYILRAHIYCLRFVNVVTQVHQLKFNLYQNDEKVWV